MQSRQEAARVHCSPSSTTRAEHNTARAIHRCPGMSANGQLLPQHVCRACARWERGSVLFLNTVSVFLQYGGARLAAQHVRGTARLNYHAMGQHGARPHPLTDESLRQDEFDFNFRCLGKGLV